MDELPRPERYDVGSPTLPGLSKLLEELGEVIQVGGKYLAVDGQPEHWDGNLDEMMADELGDALAAIGWFMHYNFDRIDQSRVLARREAKMFTYDRWREERLTNVCALCHGDACEEGCGQGGQRSCEMSPSAAGPDAHRACIRCGGRGRVDRA